MKYILSIDQGTTSSRAILFNKKMKIKASAQEEFEQHFPKSGWVEHKANDLYESVINVCKAVIKKADIKVEDILSIGITNQRETTIVWDKKTGKAVYNAIVWQDRRTSKMCESLKKEFSEQTIREKTGLLFDSYFSGTKIKWILDNVKGARKKANEGKLLFGTVDSYLIWRLSNKKSHVTDATNAARTMLFNIKTQEWDEEICALLDIPMNMLPEVKDCASDFAVTSKKIFGSKIPINGVAGDQQAATIGQACFEKGMLKSTYGTGCFALLNTGEQMVLSKNKLLSTIAYRLDGKTTYALEGSIFVAGAIVQWLRDGLKIIDNAKDTNKLAKKADKQQEVYIVPAFTGLGAPYWDSECRGAIYGLTRNTSSAELAKAALESVAYQSKDLLDAMKEDCLSSENKISNKTVLRVDGGMSASSFTIQNLSDILGASVDRPKILETTALGVAYLAGMHIGFYPDLEEFAKNWALDKRFEPKMSKKKSQRKYNLWCDAVKRTLSKQD